jgi:hypothetical protein
MSKEAMKLAFEALETYYGYMEPLTTVFGGPRVPAEQSTTGKVETAITSLRQAIAEAEKQEPVSYTTGHCKEKAQPNGCQLHNLHCGYPVCDRKAVFNRQQRKPLTHEQRFDLLTQFEPHKNKWEAPAILIDMVEAAHGIKE